MVRALEAAKEKRQRLEKEKEGSKHGVSEGKDKVGGRDNRDEGDGLGFSHGWLTEESRRG